MRRRFPRFPLYSNCRTEVSWLLSQATIHVAAVLLPKLQIDWICCSGLCFEVSEGVITAVQLNF